MAAAYSGCSLELQTIPDYKMLEDARKCAQLYVFYFGHPLVESVWRAYPSNTTGIIIQIQ